MKNVIVIIIIIIAMIFIFKRMNFLKNNVIKNSKDEIDKIRDIIDKNSNIYYIEDLKNIELGKDIDVSNLDNNITTINTVNEYDYTFKVNLCSNICINLQSFIKYLFVKNNCFIVCLQKEYIGSLIFNKNKIVITNQNFDELEKMRKIILEYIYNDANMIIQKSKDNQ